MNTPEPRGQVVALTADLIFASRIRAVAEGTGAAVVLARSPAALLQVVAEGATRRVLIDLDGRYDAAGLIAELKSKPETAFLNVIAFVSHVREDAIAAARSAGADSVLARSAFVRELNNLLTT